MQFKGGGRSTLKRPNRTLNKRQNVNNQRITQLSSPHHVKTPLHLSHRSLLTAPSQNKIKITHKNSTTLLSSNKNAKRHFSSIDNNSGDDYDDNVEFDQHNPESGIPCNFIELPGNPHTPPIVKPFSVMSLTDNLHKSRTLDETQVHINSYMDMNGRVIKLYPGYENAIFEVLSQYSSYHNVSPDDFTLILPLSVYEAETGLPPRSHPVQPYQFNSIERYHALRDTCPHYVPHRRGLFVYKTIQQLATQLDGHNIDVLLGLPYEHLYTDIPQDDNTTTSTTTSTTSQASSSQKQHQSSSSSSPLTDLSVKQSSQSKKHIIQTDIHGNEMVISPGYTRVPLKQNENIIMDHLASQELPSGLEPQRDPVSNIGNPAGRYFGDRLRDKVLQVTGHLLDESVDIIVINELEHLTDQTMEHVYNILLESFFQSELLVYQGKTRGYALSSRMLSTHYTDEKYLSSYKVMLISNFASELARMYLKKPTLDPDFHPNQVKLLMEMCNGVVVPSSSVIDDSDCTLSQWFIKHSNNLWDDDNNTINNDMSKTPSSATTTSLQEDTLQSLLNNVKEELKQQHKKDLIKYNNNSLDSTTTTTTPLYTSGIIPISSLFLDSSLSPFYSKPFNLQYKSKNNTTNHNTSIKLDSSNVHAKIADIVQRDFMRITRVKQTLYNTKKKLDDINTTTTNTTTNNDQQTTSSASASSSMNDSTFSTLPSTLDDSDTALVRLQSQIDLLDKSLSQAVYLKRTQMKTFNARGINNNTKDQQHITQDDAIARYKHDIHKLLDDIEKNELDGDIMGDGNNNNTINIQHNNTDIHTSTSTKTAYDDIYNDISHLYSEDELYIPQNNANNNTTTNKRHSNTNNADTSLSDGTHKHHTTDVQVPSSSSSKLLSRPYDLLDDHPAISPSVLLPDDVTELVSMVDPQAISQSLSVLPNGLSRSNAYSTLTTNTSQYKYYDPYHDPTHGGLQNRIQHHTIAQQLHHILPNDDAYEIAELMANFSEKRMDKMLKIAMRKRSIEMVDTFINYALRYKAKYKQYQVSLKQYNEQQQQQDNKMKKPQFTINDQSMHDMLLSVRPSSLRRWEHWKSGERRHHATQLISIATEAEISNMFYNLLHPTDITTEQAQVVLDSNQATLGTFLRKSFIEHIVNIKDNLTHKMNSNNSKKKKSSKDDSTTTNTPITPTTTTTTTSSTPENDLLSQLSSQQGGIYTLLHNLTLTPEREYELQSLLPYLSAITTYGTMPLIPLHNIKHHSQEIHTLIDNIQLSLPKDAVQPNYSALLDLPQYTPPPQTTTTTTTTTPDTESPTQPNNKSHYKQPLQYQSLTNDRLWYDSTYYPKWTNNTRLGSLLLLEPEINLLNTNYAMMSNHPHHNISNIIKLMNETTSHAFSSHQPSQSPSSQQHHPWSPQTLADIQYKFTLQTTPALDYAINHGLLCVSNNTFDPIVNNRVVRLLDSEPPSQPTRQYLSESFQHKLSFLSSMENAYPHLAAEYNPHTRDNDDNNNPLTGTTFQNTRKYANIRGLPPVIAVSMSSSLYTQLPFAYTVPELEHLLYTRLLPSVQGAIDTLQHIDPFKSFAEQLSVAVDQVKDTVTATILAYNSPLIHTTQNYLSRQHNTLAVLNSISQQTLLLLLSLGVDAVGVPDGTYPGQISNFLQKANKSGMFASSSSSSLPHDHQIITKSEAITILRRLHNDIIPLLRQHMTQIDQWVHSTQYFKNMEPALGLEDAQSHALLEGAVALSSSNLIAPSSSQQQHNNNNTEQQQQRSTLPQISSSKIKDLIYDERLNTINPYVPAEMALAYNQPLSERQITILASHYHQSYNIDYKSAGKY